MLFRSNTLRNAENYIIEYHMASKNNNTYFSDFLKPFESQNYTYLLKANNKKGDIIHDILISLSKSNGG